MGLDTECDAVRVMCFVNRDVPADNLTTWVGVCVGIPQDPSYITQHSLPT